MKKQKTVQRLAVDIPIETHCWIREVAFKRGITIKTYIMRILLKALLEEK